MDSKKKIAQKPKQVTIRDIAKLANVSIATVSRVLSEPHKVSTETQQLVMDTVQRTGYVMNEAARSLSRRKTDTIVILAPAMGSFVAEIVTGVESVCADNNLGVLIADTKNIHLSSERARSYFSKSRVDGVIILDGLAPADVINNNPNRPPILFAGEWNPNINLPTIAINDELGTELAVRHLHALGHRSFGHIAGVLRHLPGQRRCNSYHRVLSNLGINAGQGWLFEGDFSLASGKAAADDWLKRPSHQRPSAIFCAGDEMAFGFISTLKRAGCEIPRDVSIVGYDDIPIAEYYTPALTTIHQPYRQLGVLSAHTLLALMNGETYTPLPMLQPSLKVRDSTRSVIG